jgi:CRP/FNR family transcriptional regulator, transcriptional activator FtrB
MPMTSQDRSQATATPLLRGLDHDRVERLLSGASIRRVPKRVLLFEEGSLPECLYLLLSGSVEAFTSEGGRDWTILIFSHPDIFIPGAALVDEQYLVSARTLKMSRLLLIPAETVRSEMAQCPVFACRLVTLLAGQFRVALRHIKDLKTRTGPQRLAAYLLRLVEEKGMAGSAELPHSKGTLASRLGMSAETLSRSLQVVADHGVVVRGHRVVIQDLEEAEAFCRRNPLIDGGETGLEVNAW